MMTNQHGCAFADKRGQGNFADATMIGVGSFALVYLTGLLLIWGRKLQSKVHVLLQ